MERRFKIETDTGISGTFKWPVDEQPESTEEKRDALRQYGNFIYGAGGEPVQWEYQNHWLPRLQKATEFKLTILDE